MLYKESKHSRFVCFITIKSLVKTRQKKSVLTENNISEDKLFQTTLYHKRLLHKVTSGTSPLNWSGLSAAKNTSTMTAAFKRGKMQPFLSFNGKTLVQKALLCPRSQERKCLLWWQNKKLFQGQEGRERERASRIQLEIPHDLKLPGESPQRVSMEKEESILALPVKSQTTADDCE